MNESNNIGRVLLGRYQNESWQLMVDCYPKTAEIRVTLIPVHGSGPLVITQNLGEPMPPYRAFLAPGVLSVQSSAFMDFMEQNRLGYIVDYKRYAPDARTGRPRRTAAVFQFDPAVLRRFHRSGCLNYEKHHGKLTRKNRPADSAALLCAQGA